MQATSREFIQGISLQRGPLSSSTHNDGGATPRDRTRRIPSPCIRRPMNPLGTTGATPELAAFALPIRPCPCRSPLSSSKYNHGVATPSDRIRRIITPSIRRPRILYGTTGATREVAITAASLPQGSGRVVSHRSYLSQFFSVLCAHSRWSRRC